MPHFYTYTEYLFAHDQSRMRKMQSGERIMRISLSALLYIHIGQVYNNTLRLISLTSKHCSIASDFRPIAFEEVNTAHDKKVVLLREVLYLK